MTAPSNGIRVLIVEDEFLLALSLEEELRAAGYGIVGPYNTLQGAIDAVPRERFDLAVVDMNLNGVMAFPLLDVLVARNVSALILSGYAQPDLPVSLRALPRVAKPATAASVLAAVAKLVAGTTG